MIHKRVSTIVSVCVGIFVLGRATPLPEVEDNPAERINAVGEESQIGIIVSPIMRYKMNREIVVVWNFSNLQRGDDRLFLYDGRPDVNGSRALYSFEPRKLTGTRKTRVPGVFVPTTELTFDDRCLRYYVVWYRNDIVQMINCLAIHPNWMSRRRNTLGPKRLNEIFIPGTHDSGAYAKEKKSKLESVIDKYVITQDEDILSQLIYGVRYLDIRVGRHPGAEDVFWANHGYFSIHKLTTVIDDVKSFLNNTQEIVIFDVHEFPIGFGIYPVKAHEEFVAYLEEQFAGYYLPKTVKGWGMSLEEIWATGKRLIIGYNRKEIYEKHASTWQAVNHRWPKVKTMNDLWTKINEFEMNNKLIGSSTSEPPSSVMAQFTPEPVDVILDLLGGIRSMAELVNTNVTASYNQKWGCHANIVSMDYIKGSGIIETAIKWNDRRPSVC